MNPNEVIIQNIHDGILIFCLQKIDMPQKGLKKVMGFGEAEKTVLKSFFCFPKCQPHWGTGQFIIEFRGVTDGKNTV